MLSLPDQLQAQHSRSMAVNSSTVNVTVSEDRYGLGTDNHSSSMVFTSETTTTAGIPDDTSTLVIIVGVLLPTLVILLAVQFLFLCLWRIRMKKRCWCLSKCNARKSGQKAPEAEGELLMTDSTTNNRLANIKVLQYSEQIDGHTDADDDPVDGCKENRYLKSFNRKATLNIPCADSAFDETSLMDGLPFNNLDSCSSPQAAKISDKSFVYNFQSFTSLRNIDEFSYLGKDTERRGIANNRKAISAFQPDTRILPRPAFLIGKESDDSSYLKVQSEISLEHWNLDDKVILFRRSEWNECRRKEKVETDILLTSPAKKKDQEETAVVHQKNVEEKSLDQLFNEISQIDIEKIDWNQVFNFFSEKLGAEWRLFFLRLYGFSKVKIEMIDDRMSHTEETTRRKHGGNNSRCVIIDQFQAWKASQGKSASHLTICETLKDMNRNDLWGKFVKFMSKLPLVHYESRCSLNSLDSYNSNNPSHWSGTSVESFVNGDMFLDSRFPNGQCSITHKRYEEICITSERRQGQGDGEEQNEGNTEPKSYAFQMSIDKGTQTAIENVAEAYSQPQVQERKLASCPSLTERSRRSNGKERKLNKKKFKRKRNKMPKHLYLSTESLSSDTFFIMAKALLESQVKTIPKDMYERFVRNLILDITQETGSSELTVLSLKVTEFNLNRSLQTSRETIYSLYAGDKLLILRNSVFDYLLLYVKEARKRIVDKLPTEDTPDNYVFVTFEGKPLIEKIQSEAAAEGSDTSLDDTKDISVKEPSSSSGEEN